MQGTWRKPIRLAGSVACCLTLLGWGAARADLIAVEAFDYAATAWDGAIPGNYAGGTGWASAWQIDLAPTGGHDNGHAAIFGTSAYDPYEPQMAYTAGHGGIMFRVLAAPLANTVGTSCFFSADIYTPVAANTSVYIGIGGFSIGIESQAGKLGELILFTPDAAQNTWAAVKPAEMTDLYGEWHHVMGQVEFIAGGSIFRAWVDAPSSSAVSMQVTSTVTTFANSEASIAHWGDSSFALVDNITAGSSFQDIAATPEPSTAALLCLGLAAAALRRRRQTPPPHCRAR